MLHGYLTRPLYDRAKINGRLNTVETVIYELESGWKNSLAKRIMDNIRGIADISRIYHELRIGNYKAATWKKLRNYVINIICLKQHIQSSTRLMGCKVFGTFTESFDVEDVRAISQKLEDILGFDSDIDNIENKSNVDSEFEVYRNNYDEMEHILNELSLDLSKKAKADIVTAYIPQFGYLHAIERRDQNKNRNQDIYLALERVFQTSTTNYYKNDTMLEMDSKYGDLYSLIRDKEIEILYKLKSEIMPLLNKLLT